MKYNNIVKASFKVRHNRFTATCIVEGKDELCHVKNTGRLGELLLPDAVVYLEKSGNQSRKTRYSLVAVENEGRVVNVDSTSPNKVFYEYVTRGGFLPGITYVKPEKTFGKSRFDFYIETEHEKIFVEVKGVTLRDGNTALFPDAPTERGVKHLYELIECAKMGYSAYIVFVCTMKGIDSFSPNEIRHKEFALALSECSKNGVNILCYDCKVNADFLQIDRKVQLKL